jgi:hypothetical protein
LKIVVETFGVFSIIAARPTNQLADKVPWPTCYSFCSHLHTKHHKT